MLASFLLTVIAAAPMDGELIFPLQEKHSHGSSIAELPNGDLLAAWFYGSGEREANDVRIQGARKKRGSDTWSPVFDMADTPNVPDCNPVLFIDGDQKLWLFWFAVTQNRWERSLLRYRTSTHYNGKGAPKWDWQDIIILKPGESFSDDIAAGLDAIDAAHSEWAEYPTSYDQDIREAARDITNTEEGWMTRTTLITLKSGRIILPVYHDGFNLSAAAYSDDSGQTWRISKPIVGLGPLQPAIVEKSDGSLVAYMRDAGPAPKRIMVATSPDQGSSWTATRDMDIPNPGSSLAVIRHSNGNWILLANDDEESRGQLTAYLSEDEGKSWPHRRTVEKEDVSGANGFSYPAMVEGRDAMIQATYTYSHRDGQAIKHISFSPEWILGGN